MFSYVFMKILESRPRSYDRVMEKASRGRIRRIKQDVAAEVPKGGRVLKTNGICVIADEVLPRAALKRALYSLVRAPVLAASYLVSRAITRPVDDLCGEMAAAGFSVIKEVRSHGDAFALVVGTLEGGVA